MSFPPVPPPLPSRRKKRRRNHAGAIAIWTAAHVMLLMIAFAGYSALRQLGPAMKLASDFINAELSRDLKRFDDHQREDGLPILRPGDDVIVGKLGVKAWFTPTQGDFNDAYKFVGRDMPHRFLEMQLKDRIFYLQEPTPAKFIEYGELSHRIEVTSGPFQGERGWAPKVWIKKTEEKKPQPKEQPKDAPDDDEDNDEVKDDTLEIPVPPPSEPPPRQFRPRRRNEMPNHRKDT